MSHEWKTDINIKDLTKQVLDKTRILKGDIKLDQQSTITENTPINPSHYKAGGMEVMDIMEEKLTVAALRGYLQGNILKYLFRYEYKDGLQDLRKAEWYLKRLITNMENKEKNGVRPRT
jgi:hypothetical protein|tara:strand:+ start:1007 stop:1363 length:357 start_codon:yes stop_codon:yes gene_type:complete